MVAAIQKVWACLTLWSPLLSISLHHKPGKMISQASNSSVNTLSRVWDTGFPVALPNVQNWQNALCNMSCHDLHFSKLHCSHLDILQWGIHIRQETLNVSQALFSNFIFCDFSQLHSVPEHSTWRVLLMVSHNQCCLVMYHNHPQCELEVPGSILIFSCCNDFCDPKTLCAATHLRSLGPSAQFKSMEWGVYQPSQYWFWMKMSR